MEELGRNMATSDFIDGKTIAQPQNILQANFEGVANEPTFRPQISVPTHAYHPSYLDLSNFSNRLLYSSSYNSSTNVDRFPFFGHQYLHHPTNPSPTNSSTTTSSMTPPATSVTVEKTDKKEKRAMHQRIRRINETEQEKEIRRQKNREINRRRRANLKETDILIEQSRNREINRRRRASLKELGISTEQSRNRLRQRIKREISRMLRTGKKREDFLKETFAEIRIFFSEQQYNSLYQRVIEIIDYIDGRSSATLKETDISTELPRNRLRQRIKREISRMLRTGEKREDFLKETFAEVRLFFSDEQYNSLYQRVLETNDRIQSLGPLQVNAKMCDCAELPAN